MNFFENLFNKNLNKSWQNRGFTLAEILIVLGIIGVVAAITIPTLMANYRKNVVVTRMQKFYTTFNQALMLSELDNGTMDNWTLATMYDYDSNKLFYETYLQKYLKVIKTEKRSEILPLLGIKLYFMDGSAATIDRDYIVYAPIASKTDVYGRDLFVFNLKPDYKNSTNQRCRTRLVPAGCYYMPDRNYFRGDIDGMGCTETPSLAGQRRYCAALIMVDGWKISDDYPLKF